MRPIRFIGPRNTIRFLTGAAATAVLGIAAPALAAPFMTLGDAAPPPLAYLDFCARHADQCLIEPAAPSAVVLPPTAAPTAEPVAALDAAAANGEKTPIAVIFARHAEAMPNYAVHLADAPAPLPGRGMDFWRTRIETDMASPRPVVSPSGSFWALRTDGSFAVRLAQAAAKSAAPAASSASISLEQAVKTVRGPETTDQDGGVLHSTPQFLALLQQVNRSINGAIIKRDDMSSRGMPDHWDLPLADGGRPYGDCEDFVLEKRRALVAQGVSPRALSMAIARTRRGELHAVLVVATDRGDLVLDNLSPWVTPWAELNYSWVQRQVAGDAFKWAVITG